VKIAQTVTMVDSKNGKFAVWWLLAKICARMRRKVQFQPLVDEALKDFSATFRIFYVGLVLTQHRGAA